MVRLNEVLKQALAISLSWANIAVTGYGGVVPKTGQLGPALTVPTGSVVRTVARCKAHLGLELGRVQKLDLLVSPPYKYKGRCILWN